MDLGVKILVCFSLVLYHGRAFAQIWDTKSIDNMLFQMEYYMSKAPKKSNESIKFHELGYVGGAIGDMWMRKHCSLKVDKENVIKECMTCFEQNYGKNESITCSDTFLPEEYKKCWPQKAWDKIEAKEWMQLLKCWRKNLKQYEFQKCLASGPDSTKKGINKMDGMTYVKWCMERKKREFQAMIRGEMLNRLFGGQCGFTALALMNMLPMPLNEINGNLDHKKLDFEDEEFLDFVLEKKDELSWASDEFDDDSSEEEEDSSEEKDD